MRCEEGGTQDKGVAWVKTVYSFKGETAVGTTRLDQVISPTEERVEGEEEIFWWGNLT